MAKFLVSMILLTINVITIAQTNVSTTKDTNVTVNDATYFLNKKFSTNEGTQTLEIRFRGKVTKYSNGGIIDSVSITKDSAMLIYLTETSAGWHDSRPKKKIYRIKLNGASLVQYTTLKKPEPKVTQEQWSDRGDMADMVSEYVTFYEDSYSILATESQAITCLSFDTGKEEEVKSFNFSKYLTLEGVDRKDFNELATRIANAFNFIIKAYGGGKSVQKLSDEKF